MSKSTILITLTTPMPVIFYEFLLCILLDRYLLTIELAIANIHRMIYNMCINCVILVVIILKNKRTLSISAYSEPFQF